jgi:hypothetical protein
MERVRTLELLYPPFAFALLRLFATARSEGLRIAIYETYRSQERQLDLFNKGATKLKKNGMHHFGIACDIVFLDGVGNPSWGAGHNWTRLGAIGRELGLEWGGTWTSFIDKPHFQLVPATVAAQAQIVAEGYPTYATIIDTTLPKARQLFDIADANGFTAPHIANLLSYMASALTPPAPPVPSTLRFTRTLSEGMDGQDVRLLQKVLNSDSATRIASQGSGSPGHETDHFGSLTKTAVEKFQLKYNIAGPTNSAFGTVGPKTRAKLEALANLLHL